MNKLYILLVFSCLSFNISDEPYYTTVEQVEMKKKCGDYIRNTNIVLGDLTHLYFDLIYQKILNDSLEIKAILWACPYRNTFSFGQKDIDENCVYNNNNFDLISVYGKRTLIKKRDNSTYVFYKYKPLKKHKNYSIVNDTFKLVLPMRKSYEFLFSYQKMNGAKGYYPLYVRIEKKIK